MPELNYILLDSTDPARNLAAEQTVFDLLPRDRSYLMLWRNDNAVIIGKYQNTLAEINKPYIDANQIRVVRRLSGGGAVYHDLGNLNYTFITDAGNTEVMDLHLFCQPVVRTLAVLGVKAELNGRNDITVDGKKISGNAQYLRSGRIMHHGTLLFDSDLDIVSQALKVDEEKISAKPISGRICRRTARSWNFGISSWKTSCGRRRAARMNSLPRSWTRSSRCVGSAMTAGTGITVLPGNVQY